jgi:hypothetical protein
MKGMESLLASMIGVDANKMQEMMSGFIDNAAYLARGIDEIKASINNIENRIAAIEDKIPPVNVPLAITDERQENVKSND